MRLYSRDYQSLTEIEQQEWELARDATTTGKLSTFRYSNYSKAVRHYMSLFPNQFVDRLEWRNPIGLAESAGQFARLLDTTGVNERELTSFINSSRAWFIVGALLTYYYPFGHHETFLFPEFKLGTSFEVDYLLGGRNSDGWHLVFVEFEKPNGKMVNRDGSFGEDVRKGLVQIENWKCWLEKHYGSLKEIFDRHKGPSKEVPSELFQLDMTRLNYLLVVGRRRDFSTDVSQRKKRSEYFDRNTKIIHYDNVIEATEELLQRGR